MCFIIWGSAGRAEPFVHTIFDLFSFSLKTFLWPSWRYLAHKGHDLYFFIQKWHPKLVHFGVLLIRVFILSPNLRPKSPQIIQNHIFTDLGWILNPFGMDFDRFLIEFWWIWVDFFVGWWCNPSVKRQHHDTTNDETTKRQNNEATNAETTKRRRPSVNLS